MCLTLEPEFLSQHSKEEDGGECVVGGKEWMGSTCSAFSWQSLPPHQGVGGARGTHSPSVA